MTQHNATDSDRTASASSASTAWKPSQLPPQRSLPPSSNSLLSNALASAFAGGVSRVCTHPLDTAKARLQAVYTPSSGSTVPPPNNKHPYYKGVFDVLRQTARNEGIFHGLYRGFGVVIVGGTPGTIMYLCSYEIAKEQLSQSRWLSSSSATTSSSSEFLVHFCSGMLAETFACIIYVPVDVMKERMQVSVRNSQGAYRNTWDALKQISKKEGISGIYRGYGATLASFGPFSALYFVFYEQFKYQTRKYLTGRESASSWELDKIDLPFTWLVTCSASAGALASFLTSPLDLAKLRLQISRGSSYAAATTASSISPSAPSYPIYRGMLDCLQQAYRDGGVRGLFRGAGARVIHFAPATTVTMTCFETCRSFVNKILSTET